MTMSKQQKSQSYWDGVPKRLSVHEDPMTNRELLWLEFSNLQRALEEAARAERFIHQLIKESLPA